MNDLYKAIDALNEISQAERDAMRAQMDAEKAAVRAAADAEKAAVMKAAGRAPITKADMYKDVADFAKQQRAASKAAGYATKAEYDAAYQQNLDNLAKAGVNMDDIYAAANKMMSTEKGAARLAKMGIQDDDDLISYAMAKAGIKDVTPDKYTATDYAITDDITIESEQELDERVTYSTLAKLSGIENPDKIYPGQKITLPGGGSYTVKKGDTLSHIAQDFRLGKIGIAKEKPGDHHPDVIPSSPKLDDPTTKLPQVVDKLGPDGQYDGDDLGNAPSAPPKLAGKLYDPTTKLPQIGDKVPTRFADFFRDLFDKEPNIQKLPNTYELDPETNKYTLVTKPKQPSGFVKAPSQLAKAESVEKTEGRRLYEVASQPLTEASRDKKINAIVNSLGENPSLDEIYSKIEELEGMSNFFYNKGYLRQQYLGKVAERYGLPGMYTPDGSFISRKKDEQGRYQSSAGGTMKAAEELAAQGLVPSVTVEKIQAAAARNKKVASIGDNPDAAKTADRLSSLADTAIKNNPSAQPAAADDELKILKKRDEPKQDWSGKKDKPSVAPSSDTDASDEPKPSKTAEPVYKVKKPTDPVDAPTDDDLAAIAGTQPATKPDVQPEPPKKDGSEITPADLDAIAGTAPSDSGDDASGKTPVASVATGGDDGSDTDAAPVDMPTVSAAPTPKASITKGPSRADVYRRDPTFWADLEADKKASDARIASKKSDDDLSMSKITKKSSSPSDPDIVKMFTGGLKSYTGK